MFLFSSVVLADEEINSSMEVLDPRICKPDRRTKRGNHKLFGSAPVMFFNCCTLPFTLPGLIRT